MFIYLFSFLCDRLQTENATNTLAKDTNKQLKELNTSVRTTSLHPTAEEVSYRIGDNYLKNCLPKMLMSQLSK